MLLGGTNPPPEAGQLSLVCNTHAAKLLSGSGVERLTCQTVEREQLFAEILQAGAIGLWFYAVRRDKTSLEIESSATNGKTPEARVILKGTLIIDGQTIAVLCPGSIEDAQLQEVVSMLEQTGGHFQRQ